MKTELYQRRKGEYGSSAGGWHLVNGVIWRHVEGSTLLLKIAGWRMASASYSLKGMYLSWKV
jgi:hypothetical protein